MYYVELYNYKRANTTSMMVFSDQKAKAASLGEINQLLMILCKLIATSVF